MKEDFITYLWLNKLLNNNLRLVNQEELEIIKPGEINTDSGPDIFNAMIKINRQLWVGNIEIHVFASDWDKHKHSLDLAYDSIILHIVYVYDKPIYRSNGEEIPCLELKNKFDNELFDNYESFLSSQAWISCAGLIDSFNKITLHSWLDRMAAERLEYRVHDIKQMLNLYKNDFQEIFYIKLARAFGFKTNSQAFETLAKSLPLSILRKHIKSRIQIEALLFGQAGFLSKNMIDEYPSKLYREFIFLQNKYSLNPLDKKIWKHARMRPGNFPSIRISQFADIICNSGDNILNIIEIDRLNSARDYLNCSASYYWNNHFLFDKKVKNESAKVLGKSSINLLLINTIIPFMFAYGRLNNKNNYEDKAIQWLENIDAENNNIVRNFKKYNFVVADAFHSQALVHLYKEYCSNRRCLDCRIGQTLINKK